MNGSAPASNGQGHHQMHRRRHRRSISASEVYRERHSKAKVTWNEFTTLELPEKPATNRLIRNGHQTSSTAKDNEGECQDESSSLFTETCFDNDSNRAAAGCTSSRPATTTIARPRSDEQKSLQFSPTRRVSSSRISKGEVENGATITSMREHKHQVGSTIISELQKPDPLSFLEIDSPPVTERSILQAITEASDNWSPRSMSSFESIDSSHSSAAETNTTTPEQSIRGDSSPTRPVSRPTPLYRDRTEKRESRTRRPQLHPQLSEAEDRYGTPEMARGSAKHPHFPPDELQPRLAGQRYPKHLPRAEKLPMTGYELVAAKLSASDSRTARRASDSSSRSEEQATIKPIYRKFEALNHRLLLHLQDELSELEEQLHRLDTADTQTRRLQNCILPASRRTEFMTGGELQWRKTDILGKIGFKLGQYSKIPISLVSRVQRCKRLD